MPGDNPSYGTSIGLEKAQNSTEYQEIPAQNGALSTHDHNGRQLSSRESPDREFDNPIYGSDGQEAESENLYTIPDSPPRGDITNHEGEETESVYTIPPPDETYYSGVV